MVVPRTSASSEIAAEPTERLLPASEDIASSVTPCTLTERPVLDGFHDNTPLQNTLAHKITTQQAQQETTQETTIIIENISTQEKYESFKDKLTQRLPNKQVTINKTTRKLFIV